MPEITSRRGARNRNAPWRKGDKRQEAILDSAERRVAEVGAAALTIDDVARGAGISRPSLYFYFSSKAELLAALVARVQDDIFQTSTLLTLEPTGVVDIRPALQATVKLWRKHGPVLRLGVEQSTSFPEIAAEYDKAIIRLTDELVARLEPITASDDAEQLRRDVEVLLAMAERSFHRLFARRHTRAEEDALVDTLAHMWMLGLGLPGEPG